jgi:hypothetical protein
MNLAIRYFSPILVFAILTFETVMLPVSAQDESIDVEEVLEVKEPEIEPDPQRLYCATEWTNLYRRQKTDIRVSTRGQHNEIAVFDCPDCSLEENFVKPFLESEYRGKTGMMRLYECGFKTAVFEGFRGTQDIVVEVAQVFPNPDRVRCAVEWNRQYKRDNSVVDVFTRGELDEIIVFSCYYCTSQKSFIAPFLLQTYQDKTAMQRMLRCGFTEVLFTNPEGTKEVTKMVR